MTKSKVLDVTASVATKKPAARKMKQKVMAGSTPGCDNGGKEEEKNKREVCWSRKEIAIGRIGMALHERWSKESVREL